MNKNIPDDISESVHRTGQCKNRYMNYTSWREF